MPLYHHKEVFREIPAGDPAEGVDVSFWRLIDNTQIGSPVTTDAQGQAFKNLADTATSGKTAYELHPGPYRSYGTSVGGVNRRKTSVAIGSAGAIDLAAQIFLNRAMGSGVIQDPGSGLNELEVTATGASMTVTIATGAFVVGGMPGFNHLARQIAIPANASLAERIDLIVLEAIPQGNDEEGKKTLKLIQGTVSGVAPTLTRDETLMQEAIASISVANGAATIAQGDITDLREFVERAVSDVADDLAALEDRVEVLETPVVPRFEMVAYFQGFWSGATSVGAGQTITMDIDMTFVNGHSNLYVDDFCQINSITFGLYPYLQPGLAPGINPALGKATVRIRNFGGGTHTFGSSLFMTITAHRLILS